MTPRPLYKWKSFWLGILVLVFSGWGWNRSNHHLDQFGFRAANSAWNVSSRESTVSLSMMHPEGWGTSSKDRRPWWPIEFVVIEGRGFTLRICHLAHWFLMLLFLLPWSVFLAWRWRRLRSLTKAHDASAAL